MSKELILKCKENQSDLTKTISDKKEQQLHFHPN